MNSYDAVSQNLNHYKKDHMSKCLYPSILKSKISMTSRDNFWFLCEHFSLYFLDEGSYSAKLQLAAFQTKWLIFRLLKYFYISIFKRQMYDFERLGKSTFLLQGNFTHIDFPDIGHFDVSLLSGFTTVVSILFFFVKLWPCLACPVLLPVKEALKSWKMLSPSSALWEKSK